jgi:hypothetical protein
MKINFISILVIATCIGCKMQLNVKENRVATSKALINYIYLNDTASIFKMFENSKAGTSFLDNVPFLYEEIHKYKKPSPEDYLVNEYKGNFKRIEVTAPIFKVSPGDTTNPCEEVNLIIYFGPLDVTPENEIGGVIVDRRINQHFKIHDSN